MALFRQVSSQSSVSLPVYLSALTAIDVQGRRCDHLVLLVDFDTGWGGVFDIARTIHSMIKLVSLRSILKIRSARSVAAVVPAKSLFPLERWWTVSRPAAGEASQSTARFGISDAFALRDRCQPGNKGETI
jgi:hypothetical protein